ncbi:hypothetical protein R5W24_005822 [Gemmata sp. JC717]|uniref:hypothetical protein n=1 Tax=Gemmata algarum TaxID=2975278 RepID=UPI0021BAC570|nr:hypothetical protein [Gemmata algarum]MDY3556652.1 hypothetical protein [Gemmata algarum]
MSQDRRSVLTALGLALPFGLSSGAGALARSTTHAAPALGFRSFEESVAAAFGSESVLTADAALPGDAFPCRRIEVGHSELLESGVQGCHNDRPFAGFPAGHLRIVRTGGCPGPVFRGVRLYVLTVDVVWTGGRACGDPSRPLDFALLPPAPAFGDEQPAVRAVRSVSNRV